MMYDFKEIKTPKRVDNAWGKELIDEGMSFYVGDYEWLPEYDDLVEWLADNKGKGLLCVGDFGLGKTVICTKILPVMFDTWKWDYISVSAYEMARKVDEIKKHDIIIIDDFGVEGESVIYGEHRHIFNEIVDFAEREGCLLILTSNLNEAEMKKKYGVRTVDRLNNMTKAIVFQGNSFRGKQKADKETVYVFGVSFNSKIEADDFERQQLAIRDGIKNGRFRFYDEYAQEAYEMNEALQLQSDVVFKYGTAE